MSSMPFEKRRKSGKADVQKWLTRPSGPSFGASAEAEPISPPTAFMMTKEKEKGKKNELVANQREDIVSKVGELETKYAKMVLHDQ